MSESRLAIVIDSRNAKTDAEGLAQAMQALEDAGVRVSTSAGRAGRTARDAGRAYSQAGQQATRGAQGVDRINRSLDDTDRSATQATLALRRAFIGGIAGLSAMNVIDIADDWGQFASRIRMATQSAEEYDLVQRRMLQSANATYRNINETRESFIQLSPVLRQMGMSLEQSLDAVDAFSGLLVVNAASADRAVAAQRALSTALQKGKLDAQGWITIYSSLDSLVEVLAQHSGKSAEEIRKLGASGQLSVNMIAQALAGSYDEIMRQVEGMPTTVRDAMNNVSNAFGEYIGTANEANQVTASMAAALVSLGDNLDSVLNVAVLAAGGLLAAYTARAIAAGVATGQLTVAKIADAAATRNSAAASRAFAAARVAEAQAAVAAATGMQRLTVVQTQLVPAQAALAASTQSLAAANRTLALSLSGLIGGPIGALTLGLSAAGAAWVYFANSTDRSRDSLIDIDQPLQTTIEKFRELGVLQRESALARLGELQAQQAREAARAVNDFVDSLNPTTARGTRAVAQMRAQMRVEMQAIAADTDLSSEQMQQAMADLIDMWAESGRITQEQATTYRQAAAAVAAAQEPARRTAQQVAVLTAEQQRLADSAREAANAQGALAGALRETDEAGKTYLERLQDRALTAGLTTQRQQLDALVKAGKLIYSDDDLEAARKAADIIDRATAVSKRPRRETADEGQRFIEQMRERVELLGKETQLEQLNARIASGTLKFKEEGQRGEAERLARTLDYLNQQVETERILRDLRAQQSVTQMQFMRELGSFGQGNRVRELNSALAEVEDRYRDLIELRRNSVHGLGDREYAQIQQSLATELDMVRQHYADRWQIEESWRLGAMDALRNYSDESRNLYQDLGEAAGNAFRTMEDDFVSAMRGMKLEASRVVDSILNDLLRITVRRNITGPLANALNHGIGQVVPNVAGGFGISQLPVGGLIPTVDLTRPPGLARGGPTRAFGLYEVNEEGPELYTERGRTYLMAGDQGGYVTPLRDAAQAGAISTVPVPGATAATAPPRITINNIGAQSEPEVQVRQDPSGGINIDLIWKQFSGRLAREVSSGQGEFVRAQERTYGLQRKVRG
ncbi:tape measure protein [Orrella sp. JC864]|uniref:tape measure protein n=1 Tax=Orrella sp. JC864 TaxID=3120298 RepID=UPI00300AA468